MPPLNNTICPGIPEEILESELERWTICVMLSAMAYGSTLSLPLCYLSLLLKPSYDISRRTRICLLKYVMFMLAISIVYIIIIITTLKTGLSKFSSGSNNDRCGQLLDLLNKIIYFQDSETGGLCIILANWAADGFMLWRCAILYQAVPPPPRTGLNAILGGFTMALMLLGSGLAFIIYAFGFHHFLFFQNEFVFFLAMTGMTIIFNLVTATLIIFRILYFDGHIRKTVGLERNNPYKRVIILCIESSALIVVLGAIYFFLEFRTTNRSIILLQLLVLVYVISPPLILYRVARGGTATISQRPSENGPVVSSLHFAPSLPTSNNLSSSNLLEA